MKLDDIRNIAACRDCSPAGPLNDGISGIELAIHAAPRCDACLNLLLAAERERIKEIILPHHKCKKVDTGCLSNILDQVLH